MIKMTTPESKIKKSVNKLLSKYPNVWWFMPTQHGFGAAGLDYHCLIRVEGDDPIAFFIETKDPDKWLTPRQEVLVDLLRNNFGARIFIIQNDNDLKTLSNWLESRSRYNYNIKTTGTIKI